MFLLIQEHKTQKAGPKIPRVLIIGGSKDYYT